MQTATTGVAPRHDPGPFAWRRVAVLRSADPAALGEAVRDCVWSIAGGRATELVIPAGPYRYPYSAAAQIARQFHGWKDDAQLPSRSRSALAAAMRPITRAAVVLGVPRLDWIDSASVDLLAALGWFSNNCASAGLDAPLVLVAGITADAPSAAMRRILQLDGADCADVERHRTAPIPSVSKAQREVVALIAAAPHPLAVESLAKYADMAVGELTELMAPLASAAIVDAGEYMGQGPDFGRLSLAEKELQAARKKLLKLSNFPAEARVIIAGATEPGPARELGRSMLDQGEPELAARCFRAGGLAGIERSRVDQLAYAVALVESAAPDGAGAIFKTTDPHELNAQELFYYGWLAARLTEVGVLSRSVADQAMRRAERVNRAVNLDYGVRMRVMRAQLMLRHRQGMRALTMLRRVVKEHLAQVTSRTRADFDIVMARANAATGNLNQAQRILLEVREGSLTPAQALEVEEVLQHVAMPTDTLRDESQQRALRVAAESLEVEAAARIVNGRKLPWAATVLSAALPGAGINGEPPPVAGSDPEDLFSWLRLRGATLMGLLDDGNMRAYPQVAMANKDLSQWLEAELQRLLRFPGATLAASSAAPEAGAFSGDMTLTARRWGRFGPLIVLLRRDEVQDLNEVLSAMGSR